MDENESLTKMDISDVRELLYKVSSAYESEIARLKLELQHAYASKASNTANICKYKPAYAKREPLLKIWMTKAYPIAQKIGITNLLRNSKFIKKIFNRMIGNKEE